MKFFQGKTCLGTILSVVVIVTLTIYLDCPPLELDLVVEKNKNIGDKIVRLGKPTMFDLLSSRQLNLMGPTERAKKYMLNIFAISA